MNNEKHECKTPLLFGEDVNEIQEALIIAQNYWGDKRNGTLDWDAYCSFRIDKLERVLKHIVTTHWKELPKPPEEI
jgi:hypothetical protein